MDTSKADPWQTGFRAWRARRPLSHFRLMLLTLQDAEGMTYTQLDVGLALILHVPGLRWLVRRRMLMVAGRAMVMALERGKPHEVALASLRLAEFYLLCNDTGQTLRQTFQTLVRADAIVPTTALTEGEFRDARRRLAMVLRHVALVYYRVGGRNNLLQARGVISRAITAALDGDAADQLRKAQILSGRINSALRA